MHWVAGDKGSESGLVKACGFLELQQASTNNELPQEERPKRLWLPLSRSNHCQAADASGAWTSLVSLFVKLSHLGQYNQLC